MVCCAICRIHRGSLEGDNLSFHKFPKEPENRLEWINKVNRPGWEPDDASVLCSRHFTASDFLDSTKRNRLLKGSIPTLHLDGRIDVNTAAKSRQATYVNVMLQNASNMEKIPLMDIKVESATDQTTCGTDIMNQQRSVITDIIKSIMHSLDLLIKSDPDNNRSASVRDKIIAALFSYQDFIDEKEINMALYKEVDIFDNSNNLKEIDIVYNDNKEDNICEDSNFSDDNNSHSDIEDLTFLSNLRNKLMKNTKNVEIKTRKLSQKNKPSKKLKKKSAMSKRHGIKKKILRMKKVFKEIVSVDEESLPEDGSDDLPIKTECATGNIGFVSTVPRYVCDICEVTLISEHHLTVHMDVCKKRHYYYGNPVLEEYWNSIRCPLCDVRCRHRGNLRRHYATHRVLDIETAFAPLKERELDPRKPEKNMKLLNDFITEFEHKEKLGKEKTINVVPLIQRDNTSESIKEENKNAEKPGSTPKKPSIDDYVKFNLKIIYDLDIKKESYCFPCDIMFNTKDELEEHRNKLNDTDTFVCNYCDKTFNIPWRLIQHTKTHVGKYNPKSLYLNYKPEEAEGCPRQIDYKVYVCKYCLVIFVQESSLTTHLSYYEMNLTCCTKINKARSSSMLDRIPPEIQRTADGKLQCNKCDKAFGNCYYFLEHLASHSEVLKYKCECGKGFKSKLRLKVHMDLVHAKKSEKICEVCGLKVSCVNLRAHKKVHSSLKPYQCSYCNKAFKSKSTVNNHIRTIHEKRWQCRYCGKAFSVKQRYDIHIDIHEGKTPYKCTQCPSSFVSKLKLNKHSLEHRDSKNPNM